MGPIPVQLTRVTRMGGADGNSCCKCGGSDPSKRWHSEIVQCGLAGSEHMHMTCNTCGYEWPTAPLDVA